MTARAIKSAAFVAVLLPASMWAGLTVSHTLIGVYEGASMGLWPTAVWAGLTAFLAGVLVGRGLT